MSEYIKDPSDWLMVSTVGDLVLCIVCSLFGLAANWQFLYVMKRDQQERYRRGERERILVQDVMTTFTIIQMIFYPLYLITNWYINADLPLPTWTWNWLCYYRLCNFTFRIYCGLNSLVAASMRFMFILKNRCYCRCGHNEDGMAQRSTGGSSESGQLPGCLAPPSQHQTILPYRPRQLDS